MARLAFDRAHEVSRPILGGDRSEVLGLGHRQCAAQVTCGIALGARRRDGITKNPAKHAAHPPCTLMPSSCLDGTQDSQNLLRRDLGHRAIAALRIRLGEKPAKLAKRDLGQPFALVLRDPLFGDELESVVLHDAGASGLDLLLVRRVGSGREQAPGIIAPLPRVSEVNSGQAPNARVRCFSR